MPVKINLKFSLTAINAVELLRQIAELPPFCKRPPTVIKIDSFDKHQGTSDWIDKWTSKCRYDVMAEWGDLFLDEYNEGWLNYERKDGIVKVQISDYELTDIQNIIEMIAPLPWTLVEFTKVYKKWRNESGKKYVSTGFADGHFNHGWACAFKGEGHNRLVSRRWLEFNPWHLIRDEKHDISFVQFHELDADAATALLQAKPGHERMGFSDLGGFIRRDYLLKLEESNNDDATVIYNNEGEEVGKGYLVDGGYNYKYFPQGLYNSNQRKIEIVFVERELTERELLECCMIRHFQDLEGDKPVEKVAYIFIIPEEARQHLHQLWLREIECWTFSEGIKVRIDEDYQPDYEHPSWVRGLKLQQQQTQIEEKKQQLAKVENRIENLERRIKNASGGKLTGSLNQNDALISLRKQLQKELRKQRVVQQNLERQITELESNRN